MTGRRLATVALVLAAVPLLWALRWTTPVYAELTGPIPVHGAPGEWVEGRQLGAKVSGVRLAGRLRAEVFGRRIERTTSGVWAVVDLELRATVDSVMLHGARWVGPSGRAYAASRRVEGPPNLATGLTLQPGLARKAILVFELPADEVADGELRLSALPEPRLDSEIRIALGAPPSSRAVTLELSRGG
ncbi:hypothetical protein ACFSCV_04285 [Methylopila henanensis]|uniref:DUF4352 domain-containing protein n=1 Tax=Methylopila henanensis TaxID=873516 RepID=A0ABW4K247_9HYPH